MMTQTVTISVPEATRLSLDILESTGLNFDQCLAVTDVVIRAQQDECHSHGLYRLIGYAHSIRAGCVNRQARPTVIDLAPAVVKVDADHGFSALAYSAGVGLAVDKARSQGMAALAINRCYHFSALWPEIEPLAEQGLAAIAMTPSHAWVAPAGGKKPTFGTNPFAFAWPRPGHHPFVFDFATSATARGEIELHHRANLPIPTGLAIDRHGEPTTDPAEALDGAMLTFGGHKGSALSAMVELLAGPLIGDMLSIESKAFDSGIGAAPMHGELILVIDPAVFLGGDINANLARAEVLFEAIAGQGARLPSERRFAARARTADKGITIPRELHCELLALTGQYEAV
ncbi:Ldh family oxidoreductase [Ochrobactrum soli]|nr:Ldh family oxidoreductase [[Ochrobactrum] soli]